jgi:hypothetical protein
VWHSILRARFFVRGGARWKIGSGASIPILHAHWLFNGECIDGTIEGAQFVHNYFVKSLMLDHCKSWNVPFVRKMFSDDIASRMLHMPLIEQVHNNRLIWKAEKNRYYLVCSAYSLCVEELVDVSHLRPPGNQRDIWHLKVRASES